MLLILQSSMHDIRSKYTRLLFTGITVLCHFVFKRPLVIPVIICKNDKHVVTLYNVIFYKYDRHPITFGLYLLLTQEGSNMPLKWDVLGILSFWFS